VIVDVGRVNAELAKRPDLYVGPVDGGASRDHSSITSMSWPDPDPRHSRCRG